MAKRGNNTLGRRAYDGKPYDANNSFVKKMANKVGDLMPQRSWISKWFNSSEDNGEVDNENAEDVNGEEEVQPPANKRPRIRMDVVHPPGTFAIQAGCKEWFDDKRSAKDCFSRVNETGEEFLEPAVAGPSGVRRFVSSTPAVPSDSKNSNSQRSELNSLMPSRNNRTTNGAADDNSESSESTSGCSSLIPQTNRQVAPTNTAYNSNLAGRKRIIDEKLSFTNHLQSPRGLFNDSSSRESLSSRRPSFNASMMSNTLDRSSSLSSPFYTGNVTFGGANAFAHCKPNRSLFNSDYQLKIPRRTSVQVRPSNPETVDSSGMSQTAKRILEAMEYFSSPITDAKKIPIRPNPTNATSGRKRLRDEQIYGTTSRVGLRHLTRELSVPTVPDMLKLRRRQKLQDTTMAARKIVSAMSAPPTMTASSTVTAPPTVATSITSKYVQPDDFYHLPITNDENPKFYGKLRTKMNDDVASTNDASWTVNLPNIPLPITSLPNFDPIPNYPTIPIIESLESRFSANADSFTFASPIKIREAAWNLKSINNFSFSKPLNPDDRRDHKTSPMKKKMDGNFGISPPGGAANFAWTNSSTAPRMKVRTKSRDRENSGNSRKSYELKTGSVMDVLGQKRSPFGITDKSRIRNFAFPTEIGKSSLEIWECNDCYIKNDAKENNCVACRAPKPNSNLEKSVSNEKSTTQSIIDDSESQLKKMKEQWKCSSCLVKNSNSENCCVSCTTPKPMEKSSMKTDLPIVVPAATVAATNLEKNCSMDRFKPAEGSWECPGCMLRNPSSVITCPCCKAPKPSSLKITPNKTTIVTQNDKMADAKSSSTNFSTMDQFKPPSKTWECSSCMVRNNDDKEICVCCSTRKSGTAKKSLETNKTSGQTLTSGWGDKFKKPQGSWSCESCMIQNKSEITECVACGSSKPGTIVKTQSSNFSFNPPGNSQKFTFGIDRTNETPKSTEQTTTSNGFTFGVDASNTSKNATTEKFTFGVPRIEKPIDKIPENSSKSSTGFVFAAPKNADDVTGFKFVKNDDKKIPTTKDDDEKIVPKFSFGLPKTLDVKNEKSDEKNIFSNAMIETNGKTHFVFGPPKSDANATDDAKPSSKMTFGLSTNDASSQKSSGFLVESSTANNVVKHAENNETSSLKSNIVVKEEPKSTATTFAVPNSSLTTSTINPNPPTPSTFTFADPKSKSNQETPSLPRFGQNSNEPTSTSNFSLTSGKITDSSPFGATPTSSTISSIANNPKSTIPSIFGTVEKKSSFFDVSTNEKNSTNFAPTEKKPSIFGSAENDKNSTNNFIVSDNKISNSMFNSGTGTFSNSVQTGGSTIFGNNTSAAVFGTGPMPNFASGGTTATNETTNIFAASKPTATSNNSSSGLFTFGGNPSQPQQPAASAAAAGSSASGGFSFTGNVAPPAAKTMFSFGGTSQNPTSVTPVQQTSGECFGSPATINSPSTFGNSAASGNAAASPFAFNPQPKQDPPSFGQATGQMTNMFAAGPAATNVAQAQNSIGGPAGFNFGGNAAQPAPGVFSFGGGMSQPASAPSSGFNFNAPSPSPGLAFDPNTRPSFNFTGGSAPTAFNATPQPATARKIKKAVRRMPQR